MNERVKLKHESEVAVALREQLVSWGIKYAAWDLDGSLIDTQESFLNTIKFISKVFSPADSQAASALIRSAIAGLRPVYEVHPAIMRESVRLAAKKFEVRENDARFVLAMNRLNWLYNGEVPLVFPGAKKAVSLVDRAVEKSVIVSHAGLDWTKWKLTQVGLREFFGGVATFPVLEPKADYFEKAFQSVGIGANQTHQVIIFGDNFWADLLVPVGKLGCRGVWLNRQETEVLCLPDQELSKTNWQAIKERILEVSDLRQVATAILNPEDYSLKNIYFSSLAN